VVGEGLRQKREQDVKRKKSVLVRLKSCDWPRSRRELRRRGCSGQ